MQENINFILMGVCLILMIFSFLTDSMSKKRRTLLFLITGASLMLLSTDYIFQLYNGDGSMMGFWLVRISKFLSYTLYLLIIFIFNKYFEDLLVTDGDLKTIPKTLKFNQYLLMIGIVFITSGMYYTFDIYNTYQRLEMYPLSHIFPFVAVGIQALTIVKYRKNLRKRLVVALVLFTTIPLVAIVIRYFVHNTATTTSTIVAMVVVLYCLSILDMNKLVREAHQKEIEFLKQEQENVNLMVKQTTAALVEAIDAKDSYTRGHSRRVADYSVMIAEKAGKTKEERQKIHLSALLHDVGKIGIPDAIINKDGRLTDEEFARIKSHPTVGREILSKISIDPELAVGASFHHERYDGKGYPFGLKGEEIPEMARIIAVADAYDAMASKRSYRDALPQEKIRAEFEKGLGTQFDPEFGQIMIELIDADTEYQLREE